MKNRTGLIATKIGNSSVRYEVGLFKPNDDLASADGFFIHVYVDRASNKPITLDYEFKKKLDTIYIDINN